MGGLAPPLPSPCPGPAHLKSPRSTLTPPCILKKTHYIYNNNISGDINDNKLDNKLLLLGSDIIIINNEINSIEYKTEFTEKEKRFLEFYLSGNITQDAAIKKAGYKSKFQQNRSLIAKRILGKYCLSAQDHTTCSASIL